MILTEKKYALRRCGELWQYAQVIGRDELAQVIGRHVITGGTVKRDSLGGIMLYDGEDCKLVAREMKL